jgi:hypothetical protein
MDRMKNYFQEIIKAFLSSLEKCTDAEVDRSLREM